MLFFGIPMQAQVNANGNETIRNSDENAGTIVLVDEDDNEEYGEEEDNDGGLGFEFNVNPFGNEQERNYQYSQNRRAYEHGYHNGYRRGQHDYDRGYAFNLHRYGRSDNPAYNRGFREGYRNGFSGQYGYNPGRY